MIIKFRRTTEVLLKLLWSMDPFLGREREPAYHIALHLPIAAMEQTIRMMLYSQAHQRSDSCLVLGFRFSVPFPSLFYYWFSEI
jgi:hypothetical protein